MTEIKDGYVIYKAFKVYHDGLLTGNMSYDDYVIDNSEIVMARTAGEAKSKACYMDEGTLGRPVEYTDLRTKRCKECDVVYFEGEEVSRWKMEHTLKTRARLQKMHELPDDEMFYVQDTRNYVGNAVLWWGLNSNGYVTDPKRAQKYTKQEIIEKFGDARETDVIWPASHVEAAIREYVDMQGLSRENCV